MNNPKVVSGGQTGVDRAALDAARASGLSLGGWCPAGRRAEDGPIDTGYPLVETRSGEYSQRTEWNVRDSDATLVLTAVRRPGSGTELTIELAERMGRPIRIVDLTDDPESGSIVRWITSNRFRQVNVAGPRESECPGIYGLASTFLVRVFTELASTPPDRAIS